MELLLNLAWLLLAVPAYWLWNRTRPVETERSFRPLHAALVLGCALVILFPLISATDDLHVIGTEIEDPSVSKRGFRQGNSERLSVWNSSVQVHAALLRSSESHGFMVQRADLAPAVRPLLPAGRALVRAGRAPPDSIHSF
jgi:hypothetical protein